MEDGEPPPLVGVPQLEAGPRDLVGLGAVHEAEGHVLGAGLRRQGVAPRLDPLAVARQLSAVQRNIHQLIHVLQNQHIAVELHHALILRQAERRQL